MIWGDARPPPRQRAGRAGAASGCPNVRVERIPEATHWVQHDAPERVNELLLGFFDDARS